MIRKGTARIRFQAVEGTSNLRGQIQPDDLAAYRIRQIPTRSAQATADVEQDVVRLHAGPLNQFLGGHPTPNVELVDGSQVIDGQRVQILPRLFQYCQNPVAEFGDGVMRRDIL